MTSLFFRNIIYFIFLLLLPFISLSAAAERRDPTQPIAYKVRPTSTQTSLKLQAIFSHGVKKIAVVNSISVSKGDIISGWVVEAISTNEVRILKEGQVRRLKLRSSVSSLGN